MKYPENMSSNEIKSPNLKKSVGLLFWIRSSFLIGALASAFYFYNEGFFEVSSEDFSSRSPTVPLLMNLIEYDFKKLQDTKSLTPGLFNVQQIQYFNRTETLKLDPKELRNVLQLKPASPLLLTIELYPFPEEPNSYLVQFNWINLRSKDKIWEMNRVYKLKNGPKKK